MTMHKKYKILVKNYASLLFRVLFGKPRTINSLPCRFQVPFIEVDLCPLERLGTYIPRHISMYSRFIYTLLSDAKLIRTCAMEVRDI